MAGLRLTECLEAMRDVINDGDIGITAVYPPKGMTPKPRSLLLFSGSGVITSSNEQQWAEQPKGILLIAKTSDQHAVTFADDLIEPLVDLFDPSAPGYSLGYRIHRCTIVRYRFGLEYTWGDINYYAAEFLWDMKRHRLVGDGVT